MIDFILYYLAELVRILLIVLLGGVYGIPKSILWSICAVFWCRKNKTRMVNEDVEEKFEQLERKDIKLKTGINYDFYETKNKTGQTIRKLGGT